MLRPFPFVAGLLALGVLTAAPAQAGPFGGSPVAMLEKADTNRDGYVSRAEFRTLRESQFARLDRNHDGVARLSELPRLAKSDKPEARRLLELVQQADRDRDGAVTRAEFVEAPSTLFDRLDDDRDGRLSRREIADAKASLEAAR